MGSSRRFIYGLIAAVALLVPASAQAAFPGANGKIAFASDRTADIDFDVYSMNGDGSAVTDLTNNPASDGEPAWSPDGNRVAFVSNRDGNDEIYVMNADGTGLSRVTNNPAVDEFPRWSPDGQKMVFESGRGFPNPAGCTRCITAIYVMNADGTGVTELTDPTYDVSPNWSPDGTKIAFERDCAVSGPPDCSQQIYTMNADGTGQVNISGSQTRDGEPDWSPDGNRIVFTAPNPSGTAHSVWVMNADGSGRIVLTNGTSGCAPTDPCDHNYDGSPVWSPDRTKIAFTRITCGLNRCGGTNIFTMPASGGIETSLTSSGQGSNNTSPNWQPIPLTSSNSGYPRPRGATPTYASLVPAYVQCTSPNITHGGPLSYPACTPKNFFHQNGTMQLVSRNLDMGSPDWNGAAAKFVGSVRLDVQPGNPATPTNEADVGIRVSTTDIRCSNQTQTTACGSSNSAAGPDYVGELQGNLSLRITDRDNTPDPAGSGPGTMIDTTFTFSVPCTATSDQTVGSTCSTTTSANAVVPDVVREGGRAIWQFGHVEVFDGGTDGLASTTADNMLFLDQGVFVP
jgi:Tol biopolymer transport system component